MITHILAYAKNSQGQLVIGKDNKLPWHVPEDLAFFKTATKGKTIYMGSNTFKSILNYSKSKTPLPGREIVVVSSSVKSAYALRAAVGYFENVTYITIDTLKENILLNSLKEYYVVGGSRLYEALPPDDILATVIDVDVEGDSFYKIPLADFNILSETPLEKSVSGVCYQHIYYRRTRK